MASNYDENYLDGLIAKAKKSWDGVDVESYMSDLRDDSFDKEVSENLSKEVASYIIEQMKSNMDKATIKCRALMVGDWVSIPHGFAMQIVDVGEDYAYATWEGNEGDPWEFDDKDDQPHPIEITRELLEANGWEEHSYYSSFHNLSNYFFMKDKNGNHLELKHGTLAIWNDHEPDNDGVYSDILIPIKYVHQLQQVLRLAGLTDMANNFKV